MLLLGLSLVMPACGAKGEAEQDTAKAEPVATTPPPLDPAEPEPEPASQPKPEPKLLPAAPVAATDVRLEGFGLGSAYGELFAKAPYDKPCDIDALSKSGRFIVLYQGRECHEQVFPERTSLVLLLPNPNQEKVQELEPAQMRQPIEAMLWFGGAYFDTRGTFPLAIGASLDEVAAKLGAPTQTLEIGQQYERVFDDPNPPKRGEPLLAHAHAGGLWVLSRAGVSVGYGAGAMPDAKEEQWGMIASSYFWLADAK